jgi:DNA-binding NtrC family response regulator
MSEESSLAGISEAAQNVRHLIRVNASLNCNVLILGETGTGKELVAREIHRLNRGSKMPFVAFNCGTIPKDLLDAELFGCVTGAFTDAKRDRSGLFLSADEGSLFLDEVGELPHESQVKLLRVLEEKEVTPLGSSVPRKVNVRVMAATNRDLKKDISGKMFRPDLFARLAQSIVVTPPLRERREDIPFLLEHFMKEGGRMGRTLDPDTMEELLLHPFPFNVRELKSLVELMLAECGQEQALAMTGSARSGMRMSKEIWDELHGEAMEETEREEADACAPTKSELEALIGKCGGNLSAAAKELNKDRRQIYRWIEKHGIEIMKFREKKT